MPLGNLNDLVAFLAVGQERSFTKAAARLGVSQSSATRSAGWKRDWGCGC
jgi:DNA-binding transcriptional LysR family regulator